MPSILISDNLYQNLLYMFKILSLRILIVYFSEHSDLVCFFSAPLLSYALSNSWGLVLVHSGMQFSPALGLTTTKAFKSRYEIIGSFHKLCLAFLHLLTTYVALFAFSLRNQMLSLQFLLLCTETALSQASFIAQYPKQNMIEFSQQPC